MRYELIIDGMLAVHAKHAVFAALAGVDGIRNAEVELGKATVEFASPTHGAEFALRQAVEAAGFAVKSIRLLPKTLPLL